MITIKAPIRTVSEANVREHWGAKARRTKEQRSLIQLVLRAQAKAPNVVGVAAGQLTITITRIAPRALDSDNLARSQKAIRDGIADWIGINDGDRRVEWRYAQERGRPGEYAVRVEVLP